MCSYRRFCLFVLFFYAGFLSTAVAVTVTVSLPLNNTDTREAVVSIQGTVLDDNDTPLEVTLTWTGGQIDTFAVDVSGIFNDTITMIVGETNTITVSGTEPNNLILDTDEIRVIYDTSTPSVPTNVSGIADLTGPDTGVVISWDKSSDSLSGVAGYRVYRSTTGLPADSVLVNSSLNTDTDYFDTGVIDKADSYFYYIFSEDSAGNLSSSSESATAPNLFITKTSSITLSGQDTPPVPGATVNYFVIIENNGFGPATNITFVDIVPANMTFVTAGITVDTGLGYQSQTDASDGDAADYNISNPLGVTVNFSRLDIGETMGIRFKSTID